MSFPTEPHAQTIPALDGIRALAILLVVTAHSGLERSVPGGLGVTLFFVLSGYLITVLMRREYLRWGRIDLRAFYLRRLLRLAPPLLLVVALGSVLASLGVIEGGFSTRGLAAVLFYFSNYHMIATDFHGVPAGLGVTWSLAVEEHYYLLYPPLALLLLRGATPQQAVALMLAGCYAVLYWRFHLALRGVSEAYIGMATDTRIDAILVGCATAFLPDPLRPSSARSQRGVHALLACAALALLLTSLLWRDPLFRLTYRYTLQSFALAGLLWLAVRYHASAALRWLSSPVAVYLGAVSYSVYLLHQVIALGLLRHWPQLPWYALLPLTLALSLAAAEPIRRWIEQPCARLRRRLSDRRPTRLPLGPDSAGTLR